MRIRPCFMAITAAALGGSALMAQANNVINACYQKNDGTIRRIAAPGSCRSSEIALSWNITGPAGLQGPKGDPGPPAPTPSNTVVVAKSGGQFSSIQGAINSINNAGPGNPYLVLVGPGTFNESVALKPYVGIQGAGEALTTLSFTGSPGAAINGTDNTSVRDLTVQSSCFGLTDLAEVSRVTININASDAVSCPGVGIFEPLGTIRNVTVNVASTSSNGLQFPFGILETTGPITIADSTISVSSTAANASGVRLFTGRVSNTVVNTSSTSASATGISLQSGAVLDTVDVTATSNSQATAIAKNASIVGFPDQVFIRNSTLTAAGPGSTEGVSTTQGTTEITNSRIYSPGGTISTSATVFVANSLLSGGGASGSVTCAGITNASFTFLPNSCQ